MTGSKIRDLRKSKNMTQSQLSDGIVTRNMLSLIENGSAVPSISTLSQIAKRLDAPIEYFLSDTEDISVFRKLAAYDEIKSAFKAGNYSKCISLLGSFGTPDDETELILSKCFLSEGVDLYKRGMLGSANEAFKASEEHGRNTLYEDKYTSDTSQRYIDIIDFIKFKKPIGTLSEEPDGNLDDYIYITLISGADISGNFKISNPLYLSHIEARHDIAENNYSAAAEKLKAILEKSGGNSVLEYYVLDDLEECYKNTGDFKGAYDSSKRKIKILENMAK